MTEKRIERRITYSYGVNRDRTRSGFASFDWLCDQVVRDTMGPIDVTKCEERTVTYSDWAEPTEEKCPGVTTTNTPGHVDNLHEKAF